MGMYDYFVGQLRCSKCKVVTNDSTTNIQTKIRESPEMEVFQVGDHIEVDDPIEDSGYFKLREPTGPTIRLLETWDCPNCSAPFLWAYDLELSQAAFKNTHYINDQIEYFIDDYPSLKTVIEGNFERPPWF